jgi:threonine/homoserine/homoserine lactone efflux protein
LGIILAKGIITGLILSIMLGPAFFMLLETSIKKGVRAALALDAGVLFSDIVYIGIAYFFYNEVSSITEGENQGWLQVVGGAILIVFGLLTALKTPKDNVKADFIEKVHNPRDYWFLFLKGFVLNVVNPMVIFYWFGVITIATAKIGSDASVDVFFFIVIILSTFFSIDLLKIFGAKKLRPFITPFVLKQLNRFTGSILVIFGVVLIIRGLL